MGLLTPDVVGTLTEIAAEPPISRDTLVGMQAIRRLRQGGYELRQVGEVVDIIRDGMIEEEEDDENNENDDNDEDDEGDDDYEPIGDVSSLQNQMNELNVGMHSLAQHALWSQDCNTQFFRHYGFRPPSPPQPMWDMHGHYRDHPNYPMQDYTPHAGTWDSFINGSTTTIITLASMASATFQPSTSRRFGATAAATTT